MSCVFCAIASGEAPASVVYRDPDYIAFLDLHPINPGHTLIVPTRHAERASELSSTEAASLMEVGHRVYSALRATNLRCDGANFFLSDGRAAGQEVGHVHLHVVPRFAGDGQRVGFRHAPAQPRETLNEVSARVRAALDAHTAQGC